MGKRGAGKGYALWAMYGPRQWGLGLNYSREQLYKKLCAMLPLHLDVECSVEVDQ